MQYRHPVYDLHVDQGRAILFGSDLRTGARSFCERRHAETVHTGGHDVAVAFWHRPAFNDGLAAKWYPPLNSPGGLGRARYVAGEIARLAAIDTDLCWAYQTHVVHQVLAGPRIDVFFPARRFFEFVEELVNLAHYNGLSATRSSVLGIFERWPGPGCTATSAAPARSALATAHCSAPSPDPHLPSQLRAPRPGPELSRATPTPTPMPVSQSRHRPSRPSRRPIRTSPATASRRGNRRRPRQAPATMASRCRLTSSCDG